MVIVTSSAELRSALKSGARDIALAPGDYTLSLDTKYGDSWAQFAREVTLNSLDPRNPAVFTSVDLRAVNNLTFDGVDFRYSGPLNATAEKLVRIEGGEDIAIRNAGFQGAVAENFGPLANGYPIGAALTIGNVKNVSVADSVFESFFRGISLDGVTNAAISNNEIVGMRSDGVVMSAVRNVTIENNHIHSFRLAPDSPDHPDMIQLFSQNKTIASESIFIRGNVLQSGAGNATQSIFMRNEAVDRGQIPGTDGYYKNIVIENNVISNGHQWGVFIGEAKGVIVRNNTLLHDNTGGSSPPVVNINGSSKEVTISNNIFHGIVSGFNTNWNMINNQYIQNDDFYGQNYYGDVFVNALAGGLLSLEELQLRPDAGLTGGAPVTRFDPTPASLTALFVASVDDAIRGEYRFDASLTANAAGLVAGSDAEFIWTFDNGAEKRGIVVGNTFDNPGRYPVTLKVIHANGEVDTLETRVRITDPRILNLTVENGVMQDESSYGVGYAVKNGPLTLVEGRGGDDAFEVGDGTQITIHHTKIPRIFNVPSFSISFGFKAKSGIEDDAGTVANLLKYFDLSINKSGDPFFRLQTNDGVFTVGGSGSDLLDGDWHDVTVTYDGFASTLALFVDDTLADSSFASGITPIRWVNSLLLGDTWKPSVNGYIDRFEIWNRALSEKDVLDSHAIAAGAAVETGGDTPLVSDPPLVSDLPFVSDPPVVSDGDGTAGQGDAPLKVVAEVGAATVDHNGLTIHLTNAFENPVVFAQVQSMHGVDVVLARVTDLAANSFFLSLQEPDLYDGWHKPESVSYMVVEAGSWRLADGSLFEAGTFSTDKMAADGMMEISLGDGFAKTPVVQSQIQTWNSPSFTHTRIAEVDADSFLFGLEKEEILNAPTRLESETVGWFAMAPGVGAWTDGADSFRFEAGRLSGGGDPFIALLDGGFTGAPHVFGSISSYTGPDPAVVRLTDVSAVGFIGFLQEDKTLDEEVWHTPESVDWLALESSGLLYGALA